MTWAPGTTDNKMMTDDQEDSVQTVESESDSLSLPPEMWTNTFNNLEAHTHSPGPVLHPSIIPLCGGKYIFAYCATVSPLDPMTGGKQGEFIRSM